MRQITYIVQNAIYGYKTDEFMPIFRDGHLDNKKQFVGYKIKKLIHKSRVLQ